MFSRKMMALAASALTPMAATAQTVPTSPPVGFSNSTSPTPGSVIPQLLDSYKSLIRNNPDVLVQNYRTVVVMAQARTDAQTLKAVHDDRTAQPYSILNGLGSLTSLYLAGAGASFSGTTPQSLTPTTYMATALSDYTANINYGNQASAGSATFANGQATPLAAAVNFINNTVRANSSTEPPKRTFERDGVPVPLDARYNDYNVLTARGKLTTADTAGLVVPSYLASFTRPAPYASDSDWVKGFTVTQAMVDANGGKPITVPNLGSYTAGVFTPATFGVGEYVPGIGTSPRPFRLVGQDVVPTPLRQVENTTNPYADGAFPSGHTNSGTLQALGVAFLVPQQAQELLTRAADLGDDRVLAGMHSPLDVIGGRIEATAIAATNIYAALYDANGNRVDWTNPANASAYAVYQAYTQTQAYLASACGATTVAACIAASRASGAAAADPFGNAAANKTAYTAELTYGFQPIGTSAPLTAAQVPVQAQVLLLTRFPYLTDAQRTEVLATTGLPSGYPVLSGNTWNGWGQLNLYAAMDGYGAFNSQVTVTMDATQGGYSAADSWNNDITGVGGLTKNGTGTLMLTGHDSYTGSTIVNGGSLLIAGSIVSPTTVNASGTFGGTGTVGNVAVNTGGTLLPGGPGAPGTLTVNGTLTMAAGSTLVSTVAGANANQIAVSGAAVVGGTVQVQGTTAGLPVTRVTLLNATGGVTGNFAGVTTGNAAVRGVLDYAANSVALSLNRTDVSYAAYAATSNQRAVAAALTAGVAGARSTDAATLLNTLYATGQTSGPVGAAALDRIGGEALADAGTAALFAGRTVMNAVADEQHATLKATSVHLWGGPLGGREWIDGRTSAGTADLRTSSWGGIIGLDGEVAPGWHAGFFGAGLSTHGDVPGRISSTYASSGHVGAYSSMAMPEGPYLRGAIAYGRYSLRTHRSAGGVGQVTGARQDAKFSGSGMRLGGEVGEAFHIATYDLTPFAAIDYARLTTDAFTETGGGPLALRAGDNHLTSLPLTAGVRINRPNGGTSVLRPYVELTYQHEFRRNRNIDVQFATLADSDYTIAGARPAADAFTGKLGIEAPVTVRLSVFANGAGIVSSVQRGFSGNGGFRVSF